MPRMTLKQRYLSTMNDLLAAREFVGGPLPQDQEAAYVGLLDEIWWRLSSEDQDELERRLTDHRTALSSTP